MPFEKKTQKWYTCSVDPVVLIDNTLAIAMGALLTMACNCKGHNLHSPCNCRGDNILCCCNCRGHNLLSLVIAMGLFHYPWQVAGTMGCSGTWANVAGTSGGSPYHCTKMAYQ